jgi:hypothetical protein
LSEKQTHLKGAALFRKNKKHGFAMVLSSFPLKNGRFRLKLTNGRRIVLIEKRVEDVMDPYLVRETIQGFREFPMEVWPPNIVHFDENGDVGYIDLAPLDAVIEMEENKFYLAYLGEDFKEEKCYAMMAKVKEMEEASDGSEVHRKLWSDEEIPAWANVYAMTVTDGASEKTYSSKRTKITKLNDDNYSIWKTKMKLVLQDLNLWDENENAPKSGNESWKEILFAIEDNQFVLVEEDENGKRAWEILAKHHEKSGRAGKLNLLRKFFNIQIREFIS